MADTEQPDDLARFVSILVPAEKQPPANDAAGLAAATAGLSAGAVDWAVAVSRRCTDAVVATRDEDFNRLPEAETRRAIETQVLAMLRRVAGSTEQFQLDDWQISVAHRMAWLGLPCERYVGDLRLVHAIALEALLDRVAECQPAKARPWLLRALTSAVTRFSDESVGALISEYLAERQRAIGQTLADRRRIITALVRGDHVPGDVAARTLGIDLAGHHLALIIWARDPDALAGMRGELQRSVARAADMLHSPAPLTIPDDSDGGTLLCWITSPVPLPAGHLGALSGVLAAGGDFRVAVGPPALGVPGFRSSHLEARDAERVARQGLPGKITAYRDVGVVALLTADPERARRFVTRELGQLASQGDRTLADLRSTALCYLECGRNLVRTAATLHVHRNTVVYRLSNIERMLGHPLGERPLATHAALTLADQLGRSLLGRDVHG